MNRKQTKASRAIEALPNRELANAIADIDRTRKEQRCFPRARPKRMGEVVARLLAKRGYAQIQAAGEVIAAWQFAVGPKLFPHTRVGVLRAGALTIVVANTGLLQELLFRKDELLTRLNDQLPKRKLKAIRFRAGDVTDDNS